MLPPGSRVGDYEIEADLGEGGMARVYRARHSILETHHAIKVLDPELRANPEARQRFLDEARIQAKHLDHPGIVKVTNIVATAEHAALVMELIDGPSLEADIGRLATRPDEVRRIMLAVLDAVGYAHQAGIVHRDLKPANVLLAGPRERPTPKVTDFGIAKVSSDPSRKKSTHAGARMGTLSYMSPEQIRRAKDVTPRSDIFSLGAMLYELATGSLPFNGDSDYDVMEQIVNGRYEAPERRNPRCDPALAAVIRRALEPDPDRRFGSCAEMAAALRAEPPRIHAPPPPPPPPRRSPVGAIFAALSVAALIGTGAFVYLRQHRGPAAEPDAGAWSPEVVASLRRIPRADAGVKRPPDFDPDAVFAVPIDGSPYDGKRFAPVTMVVIFDFVDRYSAQLRSTIYALRAKYKDDLKVVFQQFIVHPEALPAAQAACAAHRQGRYSQMEEGIWSEAFATKKYDEQTMRMIAYSADLKMDRFDAEVQSNACLDELQRQRARFDALGVHGVPTTFINGRALTGAWPIDVFQRLIDEELARARRAIREGTPLADYYATTVIARGLTTFKAAP